MSWAASTSLDSAVGMLALLLLSLALLLLTMAVALGAAVVLVLGGDVVTSALSAADVFF